MTSTINQTNLGIQRDEFASEQYIDPNAKLPRIQAVRGTTPKTCGFFIPMDQAATRIYSSKRMVKTNPIDRRNIVKN